MTEHNDQLVGKRILITRGNRSGFQADIAYVYYRHPDGYCQMEPTKQEGYERIFMVVPVFDHCGSPQIVELKNGEFVFI